jgi:putative phosphoesterase
MLSPGYPATQAPDLSNRPNRPLEDPLRIGIISDTHGLLRPEAIERLAGVDHILHAGDIGHSRVIAGLRNIAPTTAVKGNVDTGGWAAGYPHTAFVKLAGRLIYVLHNLKELDLDPAAAGVHVVVSGHSHRPEVETVGGVLYLNPGSAGPRRFSLPVALATLELDGDALRPHIHEICQRAASG